jgi:hypothetical protein
MLATAPEKALRNPKDIRENIAQTKRARKIKGVTIRQLRQLWEDQITPAEKASCLQSPK